MKKKLSILLVLLLVLTSWISHNSLAVGEPTIVETPIANATRYEDLIIEATVTSDSAITEVKLHYRLGDTLPYLTKDMSLSVGDIYTVTIPSQQVWSLTFEYYVTAKNTDELEGSLGSSESPIIVEIDEFVYDAEDIPPLLITEIYTAGTNPGNQVEFFELYNNSTEDINLFDYKMSYVSRLYTGTLASHTFDLQYADKAINFGELTEFILAPGDVIVIINGILETSTYLEMSALDHFNSYFNTSLVAHEDVFFMTTVTGVPGNNAAGGMNSRGWAVRTMSDEVVSQAFFHLQPDGSNFPTNNTGSLPTSGLNSIQYGFKQMTIALDLQDPKREFMTMISADEYLANPGVVFADQVPKMYMSPLIETLNTEYNLNLIVDQTEVDLDELLKNAFEVTNRGMDYVVSFIVTRDGDPVVVTDGKIPALEGNYSIIVMVSPLILDEFAVTYSDSITLVVNDIPENPSVTILEAEVDYTINAEVTELDLSIVLSSAFSVNGGSYSGFTVQSFIVTKDDNPISVIDHKIPFAEGTYSVVISITPSTPDLFDDVLSEVIVFTVTLDNSAPVLTNLDISGSFMQDIIVSININDDEGLNSTDPVKFYFRIDEKQIPIFKTSPQYVEVVMTSLDDVLFTVTLDKSYAWSSSIEYYIEATDANNNVGRLGSETTPEVFEIDLPNYVITDQAKLLITEIYVAGGSNSDPYEFFEVYNNNFEPVNLMLYTFSYVSRIFTNYDTRNMQIEYAPKVVQWGLLTEFYLNPGEVVVFANGNVGGVPTTAEQFNAFFPDSEVVQGVNYFNILNEDNTTLNATGTNGAGGLNSRGWAIKDSENQLISQGFTHIAPDGSNLPKNSSSLSANGANKTSILYSHTMMSLTNTANTDSNNNWNQIISVDQFIASPGWVYESQVPSSFTQANPTIELNQTTVSTSITSEVSDEIDLLALFDDVYTIDGKSFEANYNVSFRIIKDDVVIETTSQFFTASIGEFFVVIIVTPNNPYDFNTVESTAVQLVVNSNAVAPTISIINNEVDLDVSSIVSDIDLIQLLNGKYNITLNDFTLEDILVNYIVVHGNQTLILTDDKLPVLAGLYEIRVRISPITEGLFVTTTSDPIALRLFKEAPTLTPEGAIIYRTIAMGQNSINLSWLYTLDEGGYADTEYTISYSVTRESQQVHIIGSTIMPTPGTYRVTIMVDPVNEGAFEPIAVTVTMIATKVAPTIAINDEFVFTVDLMKNMQTISLQNMIFVYGGAFQSNEYTVSYSVKRDNENIPVTYMTIPAIIGEYNITVTVYPNIPGAFPDIINDEIVLEVVAANPKITTVTTNIITAEKRNEKLDLSSLYSLNTGYYDNNQISISYEVTKNGKSVDVVDGKIDAKNGEYTIKITVEPNETELFAETSETVIITINNPDQTRGNIILITSLSTTGVATSLGAVLFIRKRRRII